MSWKAPEKGKSVPKTNKPKQKSNSAAWNEWREGLKKIKMTKEEYDNWLYGKESHVGKCTTYLCCTM